MAPRSLRILLIVLTELSSLLYSGTVFGWAPILLVLQKEKLFAELCDEDGGEGWCDAQKERLGLIFTFAAVVYSASGIAVGSFLDAAGPAAGVVAACVSTVLGCYLFACSWDWASDWVIIAGYSCIGVGGMCFFQCAFKAQYAFPLPDGGGFEKQTLIIAIATTFGDASVCMWLGFEWLYTRFGVPLDAIFKGYMVFTVALSAVLCGLWCVCGPEILKGEEAMQQGSSSEAPDHPAPLPPPSSSPSSSYGAVPTAEGARGEAGGAYVRICDRPFASQLWSLEFLQMMAFQCVHTTRANLYLGLLAYFYESRQFAGAGASAAETARFVNVTSAMVPLGCLCAPIVEGLIDRLGFGWTAQVIALAGLAQSAVMLSSSLPLQYVAAAIFLVYRANVFAFPPTFAGQIFGARTCGELMTHSATPPCLCFLPSFALFLSLSFLGASRWEAEGGGERNGRQEAVLMMFQTSNHSDFFVRKKRIALHFY